MRLCSIQCTRRQRDMAQPDIRVQKNLVDVVFDPITYTIGLSLAKNLADDDLFNLASKHPTAGMCCVSDVHVYRY